MRFQAFLLSIEAVNILKEQDQRGMMPYTKTFPKRARCRTFKQEVAVHIHNLVFVIKVIFQDLKT